MNHDLDVVEVFKPELLGAGSFPASRVREICDVLEPMDTKYWSQVKGATKLQIGGVLVDREIVLLIPRLHHLVHCCVEVAKTLAKADFNLDDLMQSAELNMLSLFSAVGCI